MIVTTGGRGTANFGIAVSRRYQVNNEWQEQTSFFNVTAWAQLGENVAQSLGKGARVIVTGPLEQREYETRDHPRKKRCCDGANEHQQFAVIVDPAREQHGSETKNIRSVSLRCAMLQMAMRGFPSGV